MTSADVNENHRRIPVPEVLLFSASALTQFVIQAWLAYGFAAHVWGLTQPLPWGAPVALDLFAVTMMAFTFRLRNARLRRRIYAWFWLAVAIAAQVGASEGYADHLGWNWWGRIASLFPAIFLAASLHSLIIAAREMEGVSTVRPSRRPRRQIRWRPRRQGIRLAPGCIPAPWLHDVPIGPVPPDREFAVAMTGTGWPSLLTAEQIARAAGIGQEAAREASQSQRSAARAQRTPRADRRKADAVRRVVDGGETAVDVARAIRENPRNVQNWVAAERRRRADDPAHMRTVSDGLARANGHASGP